MIHNRQLSKNLIVTDSDTLYTPFSDNIETVWFNCKFFGEPCHVVVNRKDIENDFGSVTGECGSELADSFFDQMEDEHWDALVEMFHAHVKEESE